MATTLTAKPIQPKHPHRNGGSCWTPTHCAGLEAVTDLRVYAAGKGDPHLTELIDQIEADLKSRSLD